MVIYGCGGAASKQTFKAQKWRIVSHAFYDASKETKPAVLFTYTYQMPWQ